MLSSLLSDGMVLQRNAEVAIWGKTGSGREVKIWFLEKEYVTRSDADGQWSVVLHDLPPGGPHQMRIFADEEKVIDDILIGDVWVLGGQSNMQLTVARTLDLFAEDVRAVNLPHIRQFTVPQEINFHEPQGEVDGGQWIAAVPGDVLQFSAAGFFFARHIYDNYEVPVGLILTAIGGTPIEAWLPESVIREYPEHAGVLEQCKDDAYVTATKRQDEERSRIWHESLTWNDIGLQEGWFGESVDESQWREFSLPNSWHGSELEPIRGAVWFRTTFDVPEDMPGSEAQLKLGTIVDADDTYINGTNIGSTGYRYPPRRYTIPKGVLKKGSNSIAVRVISAQNTGEFIKDMPYQVKASGTEISLQGIWRYRIGAVASALEPPTFFHYKPCGLYNGMIAPLRNYSIRGVLWYQGESNTHHPAGYSEKFAALVRNWRSNWGAEDLPFIYTQLPNFGEEAVYQDNSNWARLRSEQLKGLSIANTAMAVAIDIGEHNDLHPQDKRTLGHRLSLCAMRIAYGEDIVYSGPIFVGMERSGDEIRLYFSHAGRGLTARGGVLQGFVICGPDGRYVPARAVISGDCVIVKHEQIPHPVHVRYAWSDNPAGANLYNLEGLPASPFEC